MLSAKPLIYLKLSAAYFRCLLTNVPFKWLDVVANLRIVSTDPDTTKQIQYTKQIPIGSDISDRQSS